MVLPRQNRAAGARGLRKTREGPTTKMRYNVVERETEDVGAEKRSSLLFVFPSTVSFAPD